MLGHLGNSNDWSPSAALRSILTFKYQAVPESKAFCFRQKNLTFLIIGDDLRGHVNKSLSGTTPFHLYVTVES